MTEADLDREEAVFEAAGAESPTSAELPALRRSRFGKTTAPTTHEPANLFRFFY